MAEAAVGAMMPAVEMLALVESTNACRVSVGFVQSNLLVPVFLYMYGN